jgi:hypothetical protein
VAKQRTRRGPFACVATHVFCKATLRFRKGSMHWLLPRARHGKQRIAGTCTAHIAAQRRGSALAAGCSVSRSVTVLCQAHARWAMRHREQPPRSETAQARHGVIRSAAVCKAPTSHHSSTAGRRRRCAPGTHQAAQHAPVKQVVHSALLRGHAMLHHAVMPRAPNALPLCHASHTLQQPARHLLHSC